MFCFHRKREVVSKESTGYTLIPETRRQLTKYIVTYSCPDCGKTFTRKMIS